MTTKQSKSLFVYPKVAIICTNKYMVIHRLIVHAARFFWY